MWRLSEWLTFVHCSTYARKWCSNQFRDRWIRHRSDLGQRSRARGSIVPPPPPSVIPRRTRKSYGDHSYARSKAPSPVAAYGPRGGAKQSTPVKIPTGNVAQELEAKFKSAQAKAMKVGVKNLTKEDIDGLSSAQLKELRGY